MYGILIDIKHQELSNNDKEIILDCYKHICEKNGLVKDNDYTYMLFPTQNPLAKIYSTIKQISTNIEIKNHISKISVLNISDYTDFTYYLKD